MNWPLHITLDPENDHPVFLQIADAIAWAIRRGRLLPGSRVPGQRALADQLDVHRNTVVAAYDELQAQGWLESRPRQGSFVCDEIPLRAVKRFAHRPIASPSPARPGYPLRQPQANFVQTPFADDAIIFSSGMPDLRLVPGDLIARAYRRALRHKHGALLGYGDCRGHISLRRELSTMLNHKRSLHTTPDNIFVTRGSQMALTLIAQALLTSGDQVAIESLGYPPAWDTLRTAGAKLCPIPVDADGIDVATLSDFATCNPVRAVYLTPHHHYPTLAVLSPARRLELLELARHKRFAVIEDDYDNEFHYDGRPIAPLASDDPTGQVIYVGTLSKILAPSLRIGYIVAPTALVSALAKLRSHLDRQGDPAMDYAMAELLQDGELARHARRMHKIYRQRRDFMVAALRSQLGDHVELTVPPGGMALWLRAPGIDVDRWVQASLARGVWFRGARDFAFRKPGPRALRITYASCNPTEIKMGVARMAKALADI